jgi:hypothetical protein
MPFSISKSVMSPPRTRGFATYLRALRLRAFSSTRTTAYLRALLRLAFSSALRTLRLRLAFSFRIAFDQVPLRVTGPLIVLVLLRRVLALLTRLLRLTERLRGFTSVADTIFLPPLSSIAEQVYISLYVKIWIFYIKNDSKKCKFCTRSALA